MCYSVALSLSSQSLLFLDSLVLLCSNFQYLKINTYLLVSLPWHLLMYPSSMSPWTKPSQLWSDSLFCCFPCLLHDFTCLDPLALSLSLKSSSSKFKTRCLCTSPVLVLTSSTRQLFALTQVSVILSCELLPGSFCLFVPVSSYLLSN